MKNKNYLLIFLLMIMLLSIINIGIISNDDIVSADVLIKASVTDPNWMPSSRVITRLSNGTLVTIYCEDSDTTVNWSYSSDNGSTWYHNTLCTSSFNVADLAVICNSEDRLFFFVSYLSSANAGGSETVYAYDWAGDSWDNTTLKSGGNLYRPWRGDIVCDNNDNIHAVYTYAYSDQYFRIYYKVYNNILDTWSSEITVYSDSTYPFDIYKEYASIPYAQGYPRITYVNYFGAIIPFVFYIRGDGDIYMQYKIGDSFSAPTEIIDVSNSIPGYSIAYYEDRNTIICAYLDTSTYSIKMKLFDVETWTWGDKITVYTDSEESYAQSNVDISITNTDVVHICWDGASDISANKQIRHRDYNLVTSSFIDEASYLTSGGDTHVYPKLVYQNYPDNCKAYADYLLFYFNDTTNEIIYYDVINPLWVDYINEYYGNIPPGFLGINCFDEVTGDNITEFNLLVVNQTGDSYFNYNLNNTFIIYGASLPQGECMVTVSKTNYYPRTYMIDIEDGYFIFDGVLYTGALIDAYLPNMNLSYLYYIQVIDEYLYPVEDAQVMIKGNLGNVSYDTVSVTFTDGYGYTNVYLCFGRSYLVTISKTGYTTKTDSWMPDASKYGIEYPKVFKIVRAVEDLEETYNFWDLASLTGTMYLNNTIRVVFTEKISSTIDASFYTMENYNFTNTLVNATSIDTLSSYTFWITNINSSRQHQVTCYLNHTLGNNKTGTITIDPVNITRFNRTDIEGKFVDVFGVWDLGYINTLLLYLPAIILLILPGLVHPGLGPIACGLYIGSISQFINVPERLLVLVPFIIFIGILLMIVKGGKYKL